VPLFTFTSGQTITTLEAVVVAVFVLSCAAVLRARQGVAWNTPLTLPIVACIVAAALAAAVSPVDRNNALHFTGRMIAAGVVWLITVNIVNTKLHVRVIVRTLLAIGAAVSVVAMLEVAQVRPVLSALGAFRPGFHVVGGQVRATATMFYPTITSMYLEVVFAFGLWLLVDRSVRATRRDSMVTFVLLAIVGGGVIATFTRAGLIGIAVSLLVVATLDYLKTRRIGAVHGRLAALGAILVGCVLLSRSPEALLARLRTEGSQDWYGATYLAPPTLRFKTGEEQLVPITIENTGRVVWDSSSEPVFAVAYHWLRAKDEVVVQFDGWRTPFPAPVAPNTTVTLPVAVKAPGEAGAYILVWDVVHEHRAWLSTEGVTPGRSRVQIEGPRRATVASSMRHLPPSNRPVDRRTLWGVALRIARENPIAGIGPDNFRQVYGRYLGRPSWDTRVHANNMYLEVLAGGGVIGVAALLWLVSASGLLVWRLWARASAANATVAAVLVAVWLVIVGHGLVDSFLSFTTTYVMFALAAGMACSPAFAQWTTPDAHRI
jgi:hypothetical protein